MKLSDECIPPCKICGKVWQRKDVEEYVYVDGIVACRCHRGVQEWYDEEMAKARDSTVGSLGEI